MCCWIYIDDADSTETCLHRTETLFCIFVLRELDIKNWSMFYIELNVHIARLYWLPLSLHWCSIGSKLHTGANVSTFEATCALGAPAISMFSHLSTTLTSSYSSVLYWIFHTLLYVYSATDVTIVPLSYIYISLLLLRSVVSSALLIGYVNDIIFVIVLANWKWKGFRRHQRNRWCMDQCVLCL